MFSTFSRRLDIWYSLLLVGLGAAATGAGAAFLAIKFLYHNLALPAGDFQVFCLSVSLTALVIVPLFWWHGIIRESHLSIKRGIVLGALSNVFVYLPAWYLAMMVILLHGGQTILGSLIIGNPLTALGTALVLTLASMVLVGWITIPIGGIAGGLIALMQLGFHCEKRWEAAL